MAGASQSRWENNAEFWDDYMGGKSNRFHREIIRPKTEELLDIQEGQTVLDIACGNGNFSRRLAELGANVIAVDYSPTMIERAVSRSQERLRRIDYRVMDATNYDSLLQLGEERFDRVVSNMGLMDIADITPLSLALYKLVKRKGCFVFSIMHPCFQPPQLRKIHETEEVNGEIVTRNSIQITSYLNPEPFESIGIRGQPVPHLIFHRPLSYYMNLFFNAGFVLDGLEEPSFLRDGTEKDSFDWYEIPPAVILRFKKL